MTSEPEPLSFHLPLSAESSAPSLHRDQPSSEFSDGSATLEKTQEGVWQELGRFYAENEQTIEKAVATNVTSIANASELNVAIDSFTETINVVLDGLVALGNVHPVLGSKFSLDALQIAQLTHIPTISCYICLSLRYQLGPC